MHHYGSLQNWFEIVDFDRRHFALISFRCITNARISLVLPTKKRSSRPLFARVFMSVRIIAKNIGSDHD